MYDSGTNWETPEITKLYINFASKMVHGTTKTGKLNNRV